MLILGIESSAKAASCALVRDGVLIGQYFQCSGLTHSATLLPMAENLLASTGTDKARAGRRGGRARARLVHRRAHRRGRGQGPVLGAGEAGHRRLHAGGHGLERREPRRGRAGLLLHGRAAEPGLQRALYDQGRQAGAACSRPRRLAGRADGGLAGGGATPFLTGDGARWCTSTSATARCVPTLAAGPLLHQNAWGVCMAAQDKQPETPERCCPYICGSRRPSASARRGCPAENGASHNYDIQGEG